MSTKATSAISWSMIERMTVQTIRFIVSVFLARLLLPADFGLIGMITIFINFAAILVDSGFSSAIIRDRNAGRKEFSTVFYFNITLALMLYLVLFITAPLIAKFYDQPILISIIRILGLNIIINSFTTIQQALITKYLDFKRLAISTIISSIIGGGIGIVLAIQNFGTWSLVAYTMTSQIVLSLMLWFTGSWTPCLVFSMGALKKMFGYSSRILAASFSTTVFDNIYNVIIGKFYNVSQLGYYSKGYQLQQIPVGTITAVLQRVSFPLFVNDQDDDIRLRNGFRTLIKTFAFINFTLLFILYALANPLIITLFTSKWEQSIEYFRLFCLLGLLFPLRSTIMNVFKIKGRADLFLRYEVIRQTSLMIILAFSASFGIRWMIIGQILGNMFMYFVVSYRAGLLIDYSLKEQIFDLWPSLAFSASIGITISLIQLKLNLVNPMVQLIILGLLSLTAVHILANITGNKQYKSIITEIGNSAKMLINRKKAESSL